MNLMALVLVSLCCQLSVMGVTGESDVTVPREPVKVNVGQDVILPCHLEPPFDVSTLTVEWKHNNTYVHVYRSRKHDPNQQDRHFINRTFLFHEEMEKGNISLLLRNVRKGDEGLYICHVPKLHSQVRKGNITLIVGDNYSTNSTIVGLGSSGGIVLLALIAVIAGFSIWKKCCNRRQNGGQNNQQDNGQVEGQEGILLSHQ